MEPSRALLAKIRNTLGAHHLGFPGNKELNKCGVDSKAWGAWEQFLVSLEKECAIEHWIDAINAAIALRNKITELCPGSWYSISENQIRFYMPIRIT